MLVDVGLECTEKCFSFLSASSTAVSTESERKSAATDSASLTGINGSEIPHNRQPAA
jgi:hypothetical protein